ncbi:hypothetical protein DFH08DRAFT_1074001 [Mycena albidolilacea]|uniref:F-box domain-containing protein n=1 Tax=Mycena albidolilacea TaxID=1033008 RepID=A0AAD7AJN3_9AGAR|nr:hypothetical protein DFH08DRAFT_1074001 [Mycena albidolilacea]
MITALLPLALTATMLSQATRYLHIVSPELWLACWALCSLQQLRRLSLVCKLFRSLVIPHLSEEQTLDVAALAQGLDRDWTGTGQDNWMDRVRYLHRTAVRLDKRQGSFAPLVHTWKATFHQGMTLSHHHSEIENIHLFDTLGGRVVATFFATLRHYCNLSSLHFGFATIDLGACEALRCLPALKELHFRNCDIRVAAAEALLRIDALKMIDCFPIASDSIRLASPEILRTLDDVDDTQQLFQFLAQCPQLQLLAIGFLELPLPPVPPSIIPRLQNLTAPPDAVRVLAPHRPIHSVTISQGRLRKPDIMPLCMIISRATVPLQSLNLPRAEPSLGILAEISSLFPELKQLSLKFRGIPIFRCEAASDSESSGSPITVDRRTLELNDDEAFTRILPSDDISDAEEGTPPPSRSPSARKDCRSSSILLGWLKDGLLFLPPTIESFLVEEVDLYLPSEDQHQLIVVLTRLYPRLRRLQFDGLESGWIRTGDLWARAVGGRREVVKIVALVLDV